MYFCNSYQPQLYSNCIILHCLQPSCMYLFYRNSADPFVNGSMRSSNSEQFLTRVADHPPVPEDYNLANGLNDLSNVLSRLQNNVQDPNDSMAIQSISYPNSAANATATTAQDGMSTRQSWSAPNGAGDPFGFNGPNSIMPGQQGRRTGPGEGPSYGRARMQAERDRIRQQQMGSMMSFSDPMGHLRNGGGGGNGRKGEAVNGSGQGGGGYSPSFNNEGPTRGTISFVTLTKSLTKAALSLRNLQGLKVTFLTCRRIS